VSTTFKDRAMNDDNDEARLRRQRLDRLRRLGVQRGARELVRPPAPKPAQEDSYLPGEPCETPFGPAWVRTVRYPLLLRPDLGDLLAAGPGALAALGQDASLTGLEPSRAAFVDTETTGLSLGAGTYTFLIGIGTYELRHDTRVEAEGLPAGDFVVRQFFMRNPGEERAQLHLVEEALGACTGLVSFNGRAFDLPLIRNRFILARLPLPLVGAPHLDLLPAARRIWRAHYGSCSLGSLERNVLGYQRTADDVPGWMIPDIYREYYRTGVAGEMLARVFYHNLEDISSMALLGARMVRLFRAGGPDASAADLHPLEWLSLARCYRDLAWDEMGVAAYRAALDGPLPGPERLHALRELGSLYKRAGRRAEAAALWEEWIGTVPGDELTPYVELAKHHEWHTVDLSAARGWAAWALRLAEASSAGDSRDAAMAELRHRLARLERKLAGIAAAGDASE
jgi:uncharacterized protein YprB with RNaseH-like and TPR domain